MAEYGRLFDAIRKSLLVASALAAGLCAATGTARAQKELLIAEPVHLMGYLPFYAAIHKGFYAEEGFKVKVVTLLGGAAHTNAVLSGQAWGFIGGPEHNAFAKAKGADIRAVAPVMVRGDTYMTIRSDIAPVEGDLREFLKGKRIAVMQFGGTPHSIMLYMLHRMGLEPNKDVQIVETSHPAVLAAVARKQAEFGITNEPFLTQGVRQGFWKGPVFDAPKELGPYIFTAINVPLKTIQEDPETVKAFVKATIRGSRFATDPGNRAELMEIGQKEMPTLNERDFNAILDSAYEHKLWSADGEITEEMWKTALAVVRSTGMLDKDIRYDEVIDMRFVRELKKEGM